MEINIIVAAGKDGAIGKKGNLIWHIPEDLKRFKKLTMGNTIVMGRHTWESLPKKPLPGRRNIVLSRNPEFLPQGAEKARDVAEVMKLTDNDPLVFIIGGEQIYKEFLPKADKIYLTEIDDVCDEADAWFKMQRNGWKELEVSSGTETSEGIRYRYINYERVGK